MLRPNGCSSAPAGCSSTTRRFQFSPCRMQLYSLPVVAPPLAGSSFGVEHRCTLASCAATGNERCWNRCLRCWNRCMGKMEPEVRRSGSSKAFCCKPGCRAGTDNAPCWDRWLSSVLQPAAKVIQIDETMCRDRPPERHPVTQIATSCDWRRSPPELWPSRTGAATVFFFCWDASVTTGDKRCHRSCIRRQKLLHVWSRQ